MWCTTVIPAYDGKFKASLSYTVNSRAAWAMAEILSQKKKKKKKLMTKDLLKSSEQPN
jgi:predicted RNA-binding protein YlxR (DUF448 family)